VFLGEAMLLGVPCVSAETGGITSIFVGGEDGILYPGYRTDDANPGGKRQAETLAQAVIEMWSHAERREKYCQSAAEHASATHNREENYRRMLEIYEDITNA